MSDSSEKNHDSFVEGPAEAITAAENTLRELIDTTLSAAVGPDWLSSSGLTEDRIRRMADRQAEERKRRSAGVADERALYYSDLTDLKTVVGKNWERFKACLGDKKTFDVYMDRLVDMRTAQMHGRELLPFEQQLAHGISGEFRNRVTIYRSAAGPDREYFARIEYVRDSFGNIARGHGSDDDEVRTGLTLRPGDSVDFEVHFWDPEGASGAWHLTGLDVRIDSFRGTTYRWLVSPEHISERRRIAFVFTSDRTYHRRGTFDDVVAFTYRVLPRT